ncbi:MAG: methyltransferase domain-containing protein [Deltaproteobacteria bacterium]|nr:methyltransferase domain-containing protein [Deltaproteobacteria bacterium]
MFEVAEAYEVMMGRWSRQLAPLFVEFVGVRDGEKVLDVGCGTGSLSATLARVTRASKIIGIDPSKGFVEYARTQVADPRVTFELGDAQNLPYSDGSFDRCMALLIVNFIPDAPKAAKEMRRVTKRGGTVATAMWDGSRANELNGCFRDAAIAIDPTVKRPAERRGSYGSAEALSDLWNSAGLTDIEVTDLTMPCQFSSFDDYWLPLTAGQGPPGVYLARLSEDHRAALRERLRQNLFGNRPDGPFSLQAKAWAVKGAVRGTVA